MLGRVRALEAARPDDHEHLMTELSSAAESAAEAISEGDADALLQALDAQRTSLADLGEAAGVPIVTRDVKRLATRAAEAGAVVMPAGAGGGDIVLYAGFNAPPKALRDLAEQLEHRPLGARLHARGLYIEGAS
jgi:mevalonate kinase